MRIIGQIGGKEFPLARPVRIATILELLPPQAMNESTD
jgi:hypothetical protein